MKLMQWYNQRFMQKAEALWILVHPGTSFIAGVLTFAVVLLGTRDKFGDLFIRISPIIFVTMTGFIINDIFDVGRDLIRGKEKPIANGDISVFEATWLAGTLLLLSFIVEFLYGSLSSAIIIFITVIGITLYTPIVHRIPLIKGLYTGLLCCVPLFYGSVIINKTIPFIMYILLIIFIVGRELILDSKDYHADHGYGMKTPAVLLGIRNSEQLGWGLMWLSAVILIIFIKSTIGFIFGIIAIAFLGIAQKFANSQRATAIKVSRFAMLMGALAISTTVIQ